MKNNNNSSNDESLFDGKYISKEGLDNLKFYKYEGQDLSLLVKYVLSHFWNFIVTLFPLWIAPNLITFMGFICIMINFGTLVYYCPSLEIGPNWIYYSFAIGIFIYQILDNIDGKQARRTGSSSPLGELFDHGCDSLFPTISGIALCSAVVASPWESFGIANIGVLSFFMSHWEEYHTGKLILGTISNPTEAQLLMVGIHIVAGFFGPLIYTNSVSELTGLTSIPSWFVLRHLLMISSALTGFMLIIDTFRVVAHTQKQKGKSFSSALFVLWQFVFFVCTTTSWLYYSPSRILENHTIASITFYGIVISYLLNRMAIDRITKVAHKTCLITFAAFGGLVCCSFDSFKQYEIQVLYGSLALVTFLFCHMVFCVVHQLCNHLKIKCFSIPYKQ
eukprot:TRINITY_DN3181_c0_g1_i1.p1 TRINITY_DN3181_c0_g1~~TRINITY_DN3181_c0_g1_i1.p1  ORF type:complete len:391 (-),score=137.53 TRINITY_DN3181_c0_g1_i1:63-1235(-)